MPDLNRDYDVNEGYEDAIAMMLPPKRSMYIYIYRSRVDARLINFFAPHLAPLSHACAAHRPSRTKENQR